MIPKKIHYCWFGRGNKPAVVLACIESWKRCCPGFEIIEWNENNFDVSQCCYARRAYEKKMWAFVSDYARVKILLDNGGIYIDTDVELIRSLNSLLNNEAFMGFERGLKGQRKYGINSGSMMGSIPEHPFLKELEAVYQGTRFEDEDGNLNLTTCVDYTTDLLEGHGLILSDKKQIVYGVSLYPSDFFSPLDMNTGIVHLTSNTYSIHRYLGAWASETERYGYHLKWDCISKYGIKRGKFVYAVKYSYYIVIHEGLSGFINKINEKLKR